MNKRILLEIDIDRRTTDEKVLIAQIRDLVANAANMQGNGCIRFNSMQDKQPDTYNIIQASDSQADDKSLIGEHISFQIGNLSFKITAKGNAADDFVNTCIELISKNLEDENFNVQVMANMLNFSKPTLYRKIKQATGLSAITFVRQVKMQIACKMLQTKSFTVSEVAWRCGYASPRHFSKIFFAVFRQYPSSFLG